MKVRSLLVSSTFDHSPTLVLIFSNLVHDMDLTIGSFNFCIGSLGTLRLSDPIFLGPLSNKPAAAPTSATSIGSSSEENSPVSIKRPESKDSIVDLLDGIKENFDSMETTGKIPDIGS
jgi:hypothetical protein